MDSSRIYQKTKPDFITEVASLNQISLSSRYTCDLAYIECYRQKIEDLSEDDCSISLFSRLCMKNSDIFLLGVFLNFDFKTLCNMRLVSKFIFHLISCIENPNTIFSRKAAVIFQDDQLNLAKYPVIKEKFIFGQDIKSVRINLPIGFFGEGNKIESNLIICEQILPQIQDIISKGQLDIGLYFDFDSELRNKLKGLSRLNDNRLKITLNNAQQENMIAIERKNIKVNIKIFPNNLPDLSKSLKSNNFPVEQLSIMLKIDTKEDVTNAQKSKNDYSDLVGQISGIDCTGLEKINVSSIHSLFTTFIVKKLIFSNIEEVINLPLALASLIELVIEDIWPGGQVKMPEKLDNLKLLQIGVIGSNAILKFPIVLNSLMKFSSNGIDDKGIIEFPYRLDSLIEFTMGNIGQDTRVRLPFFMNRLEKFSIGDINMGEDKSFEMPISVNGIKEIVIGNIDVKLNFNKSSSYNQLEYFKIGDILSLAALYLLCPFSNLTHLLLESICEYSEVKLEGPLDNLREFVMGHIHENCHIQFPNCLPNLKLLQIGDIKENSMLSLKSIRMPSLACFSIGNIEMNAIIELPEAIKKLCPKLRIINYKKIDDHELRGILENVNWSISYNFLELNLEDFMNLNINNDSIEYSRIVLQINTSNEIEQFKKLILGTNQNSIRFFDKIAVLDFGSLSSLEINDYVKNLFEDLMMTIKEKMIKDHLSLFPQLIEIHANNMLSSIIGLGSRLALRSGMDRNLAKNKFLHECWKGLYGEKYKDEKVFI